MAAEKKRTVFHVDKKRCIGCGMCVDACPMKILDIQDAVCVMIDQEKCLECGTCMRECPEDAILIEGVGTEDKSSANPKADNKHTGTRIKQQAKPAGDIAFSSILNALQDVIREINPVQVFEFKGVDIRCLDEFTMEGRKSFTRAYRADKLEKIGVSCLDFYGAMRADVMIITPGSEYDIPYYVIDWDESEDHIFFICDLMPSDDPGRNGRYLSDYLHAPLEDLYRHYASISGLQNSVFHWVRAVHSPYIITGTIDKKPAKNVDMIFNCAVDYLKAWLELYKHASPLDPNSDYMKLVHERRKTIRQLYKENDPGVGSLNKFLGDELAEIDLSIIEP